MSHVDIFFHLFHQCLLFLFLLFLRNFIEKEFQKSVQQYRKAIRRSLHPMAY